MQKIYADLQNNCFDIKDDGLETSGCYILCGVITYWSGSDVKTIIDHLYPFEDPRSIAMRVPVDHLKEIVVDQWDDLISLLSNGISLEDANLLANKIIRQ